MKKEKIMDKISINVIGLGYIGLPTALTMANAGYNVIGTDYNSGLINTLNSGKITFKEEGLEDLFASANATGNIKYTTEYSNVKYYIVSVPTPYDKFSKKIDASYVVNAVKEVLKVCVDGAVIIIESTVSPGTIDKCVKPIINKKVHLVHAPERMKRSSEGTSRPSRRISSWHRRNTRSSGRAKRKRPFHPSR